MPRPKLSGVSTTALQAEIQRRLQKLPDLIKQRDRLNGQIAELEALASEVPAAPRKAAKKKAGRPKAATKGRKKRRKYAETAEQFILGLVKGKGATSAKINKAWKDAGRAARADNTLNKMVKAGKLKREKVEGQRGSRYTKA